MIAVTQTAALALYTANVRQAYSNQLVTNERTETSTVTANADAAAPNATTQFLRLDFNFTVFLSKQSSTVNYKYAMSVSNDWLNLEQRTSIRGSVYAASASAATVASATLIAGLAPNGASLVRSDSNEDHEYTSASTVNAFLKYDFTAEYVGRITGQTGLLEMRVTESVTYSGTRWIEQPLPRNANGTGGVSIIQDGGQTAGRRTVRGAVSAPTLAGAQGWARQQRALLTGDNNGNHYPLPEEINNTYEFVPRIDGIVSGTGQNVRVYRVEFGLGEILPNYLPPS